MMVSGGVGYCMSHNFHGKIRDWNLTFYIFITNIWIQ